MLIEQDGMRTELNESSIPRHLDCSTCGKPVCPTMPDGLVAAECWADCEDDMGVEIKDDCGVVAAVHDGECMAHYVVELVRDELIAGLRIRKGAELNELVIGERANNMAVRLCEEFNITLKGTK